MYNIECKNPHASDPNVIPLGVFKHSQLILIVISDTLLLFPDFLPCGGLLFLCDWQIVNYNYYYSLNAWLLLCPWWLCFDWSMGCVPLIKSATDWRMVWLLLLWCFLIGLINQAFCSPDSQRRRWGSFIVSSTTLIMKMVWTKNHISIELQKLYVHWYVTLSVDSDLFLSLPARTLTLALVLLVVPFLPACNIFFRVGFVIAERVLYLSSAGYCLLLAFAFGHCCCRWSKHRVTSGSTCLHPTLNNAAIIIIIIVPTDSTKQAFHQFAPFNDLIFKRNSPKPSDIIILLRLNTVYNYKVIVIL